MPGAAPCSLTNRAMRSSGSMCASFHSPISCGLIRPSGDTAVASTNTSPAPPTARLPKCTRCHSVANPSGLEYWHIGETTIRLRSVTSRIASSSIKCMASLLGTSGIQFPCFSSPAAAPAARGSFARHRLQQPQHVDALLLVEVIQRHGVRRARIVRQLEFGIVHGDVAVVADAESGAVLWRSHFLPPSALGKPGGAPAGLDVREPAKVAGIQQPARVFLRFPRDVQAGASLAGKDSSDASSTVSTRSARRASRTAAVSSPKGVVLRDFVYSERGVRTAGCLLHGVALRATPRKCIRRSGEGQPDSPRPLAPLIHSAGLLLGRAGMPFAPDNSRIRCR